MTLIEETALRNDFKDIVDLINPKYVTVKPVDVPGLLKRLVITTVNVPTYVITKNNSNPQEANTISFYVDISSGFPEVGPRVYYGDDVWLYHFNVFASSGHSQCIDHWDSKNSHLAEAVKKTLQAIVFDPIIWKDKSKASSTPYEWQMNMYKKGKFPTMNPAVLFKDGVKRNPQATTRTSRTPRSV